MKKILMMALLLCATNMVCMAQKDDFVKPDELPTFNYKGMDVYGYFDKYFKCPSKIKKQVVGKRMMIGFVVKADGSTDDVKVQRSVDPVADSLAANVIAKMPLWKPAKKDGAPIDFRMMLPISFKK